MNLILFEASFEKKFDIKTFSSPVDALAFINSNHEDLDVVISDMKMPDMNGVELIQSANAKFPNIRYYILSGFGFDEEIENALETGLVLRYFTKPFDRSEIESEVLGS